MSKNNKTDCTANRDHNKLVQSLLRDADAGSGEYPQELLIPRRNEYLKEMGQYLNLEIGGNKERGNGR